MQQQQRRPQQSWRCRSAEPSSPSPPPGWGGRAAAPSRKAHGRALEAAAATAREYKNIPEGTPICYDGRRGRHGAFVAVADRRALGFSPRLLLLEEAEEAAAAAAAVQTRRGARQQASHAPEQSPQRNHRLTMTSYDGRDGAAYRPGSAASSPRLPRPPSQSKYRAACCGAGAASSASPLPPTAAPPDGEAVAGASAVPRTPPPPPPPPQSAAAATAASPSAEAAVVASRLLLSPQTQRENRAVAGTLRLPEDGAGVRGADGEDDADDVDAAACAAVLQRYRRRLREAKEKREAAARRRREAQVTASRRRMKGRDGYLIASSNATPDSGGGGGCCCDGDNDDDTVAAAVPAAASDHEKDAATGEAARPDRDEGEVRSLHGSVAVSQPAEDCEEAAAAALAAASSAIDIPFSPLSLSPSPPAPPASPPHPLSPSARRTPTQRCRPPPPPATSGGVVALGGDRRRFARYRRRGVAVRRRLERLEAADVQRAVSGLRENRQAEALRRRRAALWCTCCAAASFLSAAVYVRSLLLERARRRRLGREEDEEGGDDSDEDDRWMRIIGPEGMDIVPGGAKGDLPLPAPPRVPLLPPALARRTQEFIARNYGKAEERRAVTSAAQVPVPHAIVRAERTVLRHFLQAYGLKAWRCEAPPALSASAQQSQMLSLAASVWQRGGDGSLRSPASPESWAAGSGASSDGSPRPAEASARGLTAVIGDGGKYTAVKSKNVKLFSTTAYAVVRFKELPRMKALATTRVKDALSNLARLLRFKRALRAYVDRVRVVQRALLHRRRRRTISLLFHHLAFSAAEARAAHGRRAAPPASAAAGSGGAALLLRAPGGGGGGSGSSSGGGEAGSGEGEAEAAAAATAASVAQRAPFWLRSCLLARSMAERQGVRLREMRTYKEDHETWAKGLDVARYLAGCDEAIAAAFLQKHGPPPQPPHQAFLLPRRAADALVHEARTLLASAAGGSGSAAARLAALRESYGGAAQPSSFAELLSTTQFASPGRLLFSKGFAWEGERGGGGRGDPPHAPRPPASVLSGADAAAVPAASTRCELRFDA